MAGAQIEYLGAIQVKRTFQLRVHEDSSYSTTVIAVVVAT